MALLVTEDCIACDACVEECPHGAIEEGEPIYKIDVEFCTECIGIYSEPACVCVCPIDCIVPDKENIESLEELKLKQQRLDNMED
jgi:ferredoxin